MATTTVHAQLIKYAANGDQTILNLTNTGTDVSIDRSSNTKIPSGVTNVQGLANNLGSFAFMSGGLTTSHFSSGVVTSSLTDTSASHLATASAVKSLNDKITTNANNITKLNSKCSNVTLSASSWSGSSAPFTYSISVGTEYTDPIAFEIVPNPDNTDEQNKAFIALSGGPGTLSNGNLTIKAYGKKPTVDIPIVLIIRGEI